MKLKIIKPYSDNDLEWNEKDGMYYLTINYVKNNMDDTALNDGILTKRIKKNSRIIYRYIQGKTNSRNYDLVKYVLNNTENGRKFLLDVLTPQMEADLETGYNDIGLQNPIDFDTGRVIPRAKIMENRLCFETETIIAKSVSYFGFNILYQMPYTFLNIER